MLACSAAALCLVSCMQNQGPFAPNGDRALTNDMVVDRPDCTMVLGRVSGEDTGMTLLGLIPLKSASETVAVDNMYASARNRGAAVEGESRQFVNTSIERSSRNLIIVTNTKVRATGDVVQFNGSLPKSPQHCCHDNCKSGGGSSSSSAISAGASPISAVLGIYRSVLGGIIR